VFWRMKKTAALVLAVLLTLAQSVLLVKAWDVERPDESKDPYRVIHPEGSTDGNAAVVRAGYLSLIYSRLRFTDCCLRGLMVPAE
jgi:hypothetical protein